MFKTLIAGVTALSLAAAPVHAENFDNEDLGKFLFGVVAAIALGAALTQSDDAPALQDYGYEPPVVRNRVDPYAPRINPRRNVEPPVVRRHVEPPVIRHRSQHQPQRALPRRCFHRVETRVGHQNIFGKRCLDNHYRHVASLPGQCRIRVLTRGGPRNGYDPQCLDRLGYVIRH